MNIWSRRRCVLESCPLPLGTWIEGERYFRWQASLDHPLIFGPVLVGRETLNATKYIDVAAAERNIGLVFLSLCTLMSHERTGNEGRSNGSGMRRKGKTKQIVQRSEVRTETHGAKYRELNYRKIPVLRVLGRCYGRLEINCRPLRSLLERIL